MRFVTPENLNRLVGEVRADFEAAGLEESARRLAEVQRTAFTTGSEWLGELGMAVRTIRRKCTVPPELDGKLERIVTGIRRVWPAL
jgi:hypothetical protein